MKLLIPKSFIDVPPHELTDVCNGCGIKGISNYLVPDKIFGIDLTPACNIHDWMYTNGTGDREFRKISDQIFLLNLIRIINYYSSLESNKVKRFFKKFILGYVIRIYYVAVAKLGRFVYSGKGKVTMENLDLQVAEYKSI